MENSTSSTRRRSVLPLGSRKTHVNRIDAFLIEWAHAHRDRFWKRVVKAKTGCWLWTGGFADNGYGKVSLGKGISSYLAHRMAFIIANGFIPQPCVLHSCDVRACVNPLHLHEGTHEENMDEMAKRGRSGPSIYPHLYEGSKNGRASIDERTAIKIYRLLKSGMFVKDVARKFGVHRTLVTQVGQGMTWVKVTGGKPLPKRHSPINPALILRGSKRGHSKLTEADIPKIRSFLKQGKSSVAVAKIFKVSPTVICRVRNKTCWNHVG